MAGNPSVVVEFLADTTKMVAGVKQMESASGGTAANLKSHWKGVAAWGAAGVALGAATKFVKDSADATKDLAKQTLALQRTTNMDTQTASEWVSVLKQRGVSAATFNKSVVILSKQMTAYADANAKAAAATKDYEQAASDLAPTIAKGGDAGKAASAELTRLGSAVGRAQASADKAGKPFTDLGVSLADVRKGDTQKVLLEMSDGFDQMGAGAKRNALTQKLLGRSSQQLTPLLYAGSDAIGEQLGMARKYGDVVGGKTTDSVKQMAADQREMGFAMDGVKVQLGTALLPVMLALSKVLVSITQVMQPLIANATFMKVALGLLGVAFVAWKLVAIAAAIANYGLASSMLAALWPIAAVVAGIVALIAIGVLLYKNWDTISAAAGAVWGAIKDAASAVLDWLKANWPTILAVLAGPFGLAVLAVVKNWDKIKAATTAAWDAVKGAITGALTSIRSAISSFTNWMGTAWASVKTQLDKVAGWFSSPLDAAKAMLDGIKKAVGAIPTAISNIVGSVKREASDVASAIKSPINAVIGAWNALAFTVPTVTLPKFAGVKIKGKTVVPGFGGETIGGATFNFPNIPRLAKGGVFSAPTLAMVGEGGGREIVTPESLLRSIVAQMTPQVHVYIGDTELRDLVRVEAVQVDNATAASLLAGLS